MKSIFISPVSPDSITQDTRATIGLCKFVNVYTCSAEGDGPGMHSDFILKSLNDLVWSFDLTGMGKNYVSHSAEIVYGRSVSELEKRPFFWVEYVHPEDIHIIEQCHRNLSEAGAAECSYRIIDHDSKVRWMYSRAYAVRNNLGNLIRVEGVSTDITYLKHAEAIIEKQEFQIEAVFENLDMSLTIVDDHGKILLFNRAAKEFASSRGILLRKGEVFIGLGAGDRNQGIQSIFEAVLREKQVMNSAVSYLIGDVEHSFAVYYVPVFNAVGDISQICIMARDITKQRQLEEHAYKLKQELSKEKQVVEIKNQFVSMASHEFRTPLATIQLAAEFVKQFHRTLTPEAIVHKLDGIEKQVQLMISLLDDMLVIGKTEAGRLKVSRANIDLKKFLDNVAGEIEQSTGKTHSILIKYSQIPIALSSDEKFLRNIFLNLLTNAIKFSPGKSVVFVDVELQGGRVCIKVRDQGIGIPLDEMGNVFEPFRRGRNADEIEGTGLGLSIVKKAIEALGGEISVSSRLGAGSEFVVKLPVK